MKKTPLFLLLSSAVVMLLLPWAAVALVPADAGMAVCFLLFFAVNPLFSVFLGWSAAGCSFVSRLLPVSNALLFLLGVWLFFDMGETAFLSYSTVYLLMGLGAMGIRILLQRILQK